MVFKPIWLVSVPYTIYRKLVQTQTEGSGCDMNQLEHELLNLDHWDWIIERKYWWTFNFYLW